MLEQWKVHYFTLMVSVSQAAVDWTGHRLVRTEARTPAQLRVVHDLEADLWGSEQHDNVTRLDIQVSPESYKDLLAVLDSHHIQHTVMINDIQELIDQSQVHHHTSGDYLKAAPHRMDWKTYHSLEDMYSYLDYLENKYDFMTTESIGKSYEGVNMRLAKVCRGGCGNKPAMWIDGGVHAREWITPAVATFLLKELVEKHSDHPDLVNSLDWYILPCANPDGYKYSRTENRLWRKNRSKNKNSRCVGTDMNRNFGYKWGTGGSSSNPCHPTYMGTSAFSEVETANMRDWLTARKDQVKFYNSLHSYSSMILLPWGYTRKQPANHKEVERVAKAGNNALYAVHQRRYQIGSGAGLLYRASGVGGDWALGELGIQYSFTMELRDRAGGRYGFLLPPREIEPNGEEVWAFHVTVAREIVKKYVK